MPDQKKSSFEDAGARKDAGSMRQVLEMVKENKKYWLLPIILMLMLVGVLIIMGGSTAAQFIYTLF